MSEMIDKVSEAIREKIGTRHQGLPKGGWDGLMKMAAVAAIEAMREPTKEAIEAGNTALENAIDSDWDSGPDGESHNSYTTVRSTAPCEVWQAMINAALSRS
jgi:hypothetical protein